MALEKLNNENLNEELNNVYKNTRVKLNKLNKEVLDKLPKTIKLKDYSVKNYGSYFSIDIKNPKDKNNDDLYGLTIKKVDGEIVFDAKHEGFYSKEDMELTEEEIIDNGNIDMINRYLKSKDQKLITDKNDIKILNNLFEKL